MLKHLHQFAAWRYARDDAGDPKLEAKINRLFPKLEELEKSLQSADDWSAANDGGPFGYWDPIYQALLQLTEVSQEMAELFKPHEETS